MPGRQFGQGENFPGVLVNGTTTVNGYTIPIDLSITGRVTGDAAEYVASNSVEFGGEFESIVSDEFSASIADGTYAGTGNQLTGGGAYGTAGRYRYGFNGKENDNEVKGVGNQQDYGMRIYDPRIGYFLSKDPLQTKYPELSPYVFAGNNPIQFSENAGLFPIDFRLRGLLTKNSHYTTGFIYGIGDGLIEFGGMGFNVNQTVAAFNPIHITGYFWTNSGKRTRANVNATVQTVVSVAGNREVANQVYSNLKEALGDWWSVTSLQNGTQGEQGYAHGKIAFDIVSLFVGTGELKGIMKGGKFAQETSIVIQEGLEEASQAGGRKMNPEWLKTIKEGVEFENHFFDELEKGLEEGQKLTRRVSFKLKDGTRAVVDGVVNNGDGTYRFIETKLRSSTKLSSNQKKVYEALKNGTATAVGENAERAGFKSGQNVQAVVERVDKIK